MDVPTTGHCCCLERTPPNARITSAVRTYICPRWNIYTAVVFDAPAFARRYIAPFTTTVQHTVPSGSRAALMLYPRVAHRVRPSSFPSLPARFRPRDSDSTCAGVQAERPQPGMAGDESIFVYLLPVLRRLTLL